MQELLKVLTQAAWRAADGFVAALVADNVFGVGVPEWKLAAIVGASAGFKPITAYLAKKAGR